MLSVQTPAKINLFLNVRPRRADGYHEICSVMQAIQLWDRLDVTPNEGRQLNFSCNVPDLERHAEDNLVVKAYRLFWQETGLPPLGLDVHLEKDIPTQAGLGGGSSDAAAMLQILNHLSHANLDQETMATWGARLGSDVPFFIYGGTALASGRGELIQPLPVPLTSDMPLVIIKALDLNVPTSEAYARLADAGRYEIQSPDHMLTALRNLRQKRSPADVVELESYLLNDFERVLFPEHPMFVEMVRRMREAGIKRPLLCGSGSALAGLVAPTPTLKQTLEALFPASRFRIFWTQTCDHGMRQVPAQSIPQPSAFY